MSDNPAFGEIADDEDLLDSTGIDFKAEAISDEELAELLRGKDA